MSGAEGRLDKARRLQLFAAQRNYDLGIAATENYPAIFDSLDGDLIDLRAQLKPELLAFAHGFAVDDGKTGCSVEGDAGDEKSARRNIAQVGPPRTASYATSWFPADRPKRIAAPGINLERRFVLNYNLIRFAGRLGGVVGWRGIFSGFDFWRGRRGVLTGGKQRRNQKYRQTDGKESFSHRFSITVVAAMPTC